MYEKFGFTYDQTMYSDDSKGIDCFSDRDNLPMLIDFNTKPGYTESSNEEKKELVVKITAGANKGFSKSKICSVRGDYQRLLGLLKSIKLYIDNEPGSSLDDFLGTSTRSVILNQIKNMHEDPNVIRGSRRSAKAPARVRTLDEVINYLENPPVPNDPIMKAKIDQIITYLPPKKKNTGGRSSRKLYKKISRRFTKKRN